MRLLVTRPEPDATAQANELRALGHEPVLQPLLEFRSVPFDPAPLASSDALIITSGNSLRALLELGLAHAATHLPVFCVGEQTSRRARSAGFEQIAAVAESAQGLARSIAGCAPKSTRFVHLTGEHQAFGIADALKQEGFSVQTLCVYAMQARAAFETHAVEQIRKNRIDGVLLMSPRTAEIYVALCHTHDLQNHAKVLRYFCLAGSVAEKLRPLSAPSIFIAARPKGAELIALLAR